MEDKPKRKTKTSAAAVKRYQEKTYTQLAVRVPKQLATDFKEKCEETGTSQASVIKNAIIEFLEK